VAAPSPSSRKTTKTTKKDEEGGGHLGFCRREEQRALQGADDDLEEEDVLVPTLHVGARSPFTVRVSVSPCLLILLFLFSHSS
jgi:hypothetical protein